MKKSKKLITLLAAIGVSAGVMFGGASAANATLAYVGGGIWDYGVTSTVSYSNFYHASKTHRSSACNGTGACSSSAWVGAGKWSYAAIARTASGNKSYYAVA